VRFVGEAVAAVVAESLVAARGALELIEVAYMPVQAVASIEAARAPGAPVPWPQAAGNVAFVYWRVTATARSVRSPGRGRRVR